MKVARQFTAWNAFIKKTRPLGHGLSCKLPGYHPSPPVGESRAAASPTKNIRPIR